ncbi:MAG: hypothetical protein E4H36_07400, partial [Spirochaetales bacterium]
MIIIFYVFVALIGITALFVSILGTIQSRIRSYWLLIVFYGGFTLLILLSFFREYITVNTDSMTLSRAIAFELINSGVTTTFMTAIAVYYSRLLLPRANIKLDIAIIIFNVIAFILFSFPGTIVVDLKQGLARFTLPANISLVMYLAVFVYLAILGLAGSKKDRSAREQVLIWSLFVFILVGLTENSFSVISQLRNPEVDLFPASYHFIFSSLPYLFFGFVLIYYFGSYLLVSRETQT